MARRVPAGEMRHVVKVAQHKIDSSSTTYDSFGQVSTSSTAWTNIATVRAKVEQLSGTDVEIARQLYPAASYRVTIDYHNIIASTGGARKAVTIGSRQLFIGVVLNPDLENRQLELLCGEER